MKSIMKKACALLMAPMLVFSATSLKASAAENTTNIKITVDFGQAEARAIADMVNEFRASDIAWYWNSDNATKTELQGQLGSLTYDATLEKVAMQRAAELALGYSHTRVNGTSCSTAFSEFGYSGYTHGENIAAGYGSAETVFLGWREDEDDYNGQGHRRNMLNENFTAIGMGHVYYNGTHYWAMELGVVDSAGDTGIDGTKDMTVETKNDYIAALSTAENATVAVGSQADLPEVNATIEYDDTWTQVGQGAPSGSVINPNWSVGDSSIATISDGKVTGQAAGSTTLTVTVGSHSATTALEVTAEGDGDNNEPENPDNKPGTGDNDGLGDGDNSGSDNPDNKPGTGNNDGSGDGDNSGSDNPDNKPGTGDNDGLGDGDNNGSDNPDNKPGTDDNNGSGDGDNNGSDNPDNKPGTDDNNDTSNPDDDTASGNTPSDDDNNNNNGGNDNNDKEDSSDESQDDGSLAANAVPSIIVPMTSVVGNVRTSTEGIYLATSCKGTVVSTPKADIAKNYALATNEKPYNKFYNFDPKKSALAKNTIDSAAAELKATVGPMLNIELGKMAGGKYTLLPSNGSAIRLILGIPKNFAQSDKTFAIICVREGGAFTVLKDLDNDPNTITFDTTGGAGVYAIIKY